MQRREVPERAQLRDDLRVDPHRGAEALPAVDDPVADGIDRSGSCDPVAQRRLVDPRAGRVDIGLRGRRERYGRASATVTGTRRMPSKSRTVA